MAQYPSVIPCHDGSESMFYTDLQGRLQHKCEPDPEWCTENAPAGARFSHVTLDGRCMYVSPSPTPSVTPSVSASMSWVPAGISRSPAPSASGSASPDWRGCPPGQLPSSSGWNGCADASRPPDRVVFSPAAGFNNSLYPPAIATTGSTGITCNDAISCFFGDWLALIVVLGGTALSILLLLKVAHACMCPRVPFFMMACKLGRRCENRGRYAGDDTYPAVRAGAISQRVVAQVIAAIQGQQWAVLQAAMAAQQRGAAKVTGRTGRSGGGVQDGGINLLQPMGFPMLQPVPVPVGGMAMGMTMGMGQQAGGMTINPMASLASSGGRGVNLQPAYVQPGAHASAQAQAQAMAMSAGRGISPALQHLPPGCLGNSHLAGGPVPSYLMESTAAFLKNAVAGPEFPSFANTSAPVVPDAQASAAVAERAANQVLHASLEPIAVLLATGGDARSNIGQLGTLLKEQQKAASATASKMAANSGLSYLDQQQAAQKAAEKVVEGQSRMLANMCARMPTDARQGAGAMAGASSQPS